MEEQSPPHFPLRWESSSQQWWYATPIDVAAAAGHYDVVRALLAADASLLIKLTSLRRIRRLEALWSLPTTSKSRSAIAKLLLADSETSPGQNALIRAGYGGWLLYTAAAAGDLGFLISLLRRDPFLVFGEGEYGVTDLLLAAARSGRSEVFRKLRESAIDASLRGEVCEGFEMEMKKRAIHCAAKGGNLEVLKEVMEEGDDALEFYRDREGSTVLHSAAGSGQVQVVESLIASHKNIIGATDHHGNTALHIAAYKGFFPVLRALLLAAPSLRSSLNHDGDTLLHMAVAGFRAPGFHHVDRQLHLLQSLLSSGIIADAQSLLRIRNNHGRTAVQMALADNVRFDAVDLLLKVQRTADPEASAFDFASGFGCVRSGEVSGGFEYFARRSSDSEIFEVSGKSGGDCSDFGGVRSGEVSGGFECFARRSPGSSFDVPDSEIFAVAGKSGGDFSDFGGARSGEASDERRFESFVHHSPGSSFDVPDSEIFAFAGKSGGDCSDFESMRSDELSDDEDRTSKTQVTSLRERFSAGDGKRGNPIPSPRSPFSRLFFSSPVSVDGKLGGVRSGGKSFDGDGRKSKTFSGGRSIFSRKLVSRYACFRSQGLAVEDSIGCKRPGHLKRNTIA